MSTAIEPKEKPEPQRQKAEAVAITVAPPSAIVPIEHDFSGYSGAASLVVPPDKVALLTAVFPDEEHDILPTGEVYVTQVRYRRLLNEVFGPGQWAMVPRGEPTKHGNAVAQPWALFVQGRFVSQSWGEAEYQPTNDRMSYATALEACKSNTLMRCCKDLGIASECWDKHWTEAWKARYAVAVWRRDQKRPQWRRRDAEPWHDETGTAPSKALPQPPPAAVSPAAPNAPEKISQPQRRLLWSVAKDASLSEAATRLLVEQIAHVTASADIPKDKLQWILRAIESPEVRQALDTYMAEPASDAHRTALDAALQVCAAGPKEKA